MEIPIIMWEKIQFHELPSWLQRKWDRHNFRIEKKVVKVFHNDQYSFKVLHIRDRRGRIHTHCWKRYNHPTKLKYESIKPVIIVAALFFVGFFLYTQPGFFTDLIPKIDPLISTQNIEFPIENSQQGYTGRYKVGNIATDNAGTEGMAIVSNNFKGQYYVKKVYLEASRKGWYTMGKIDAIWVSYSQVESQYPVAWSGGIMDTAHIPDRDWTSSGDQTSIQPHKTISTSTYSISSTSTANAQSLNIYEIERQIFSLTNNERSSRGIAPLLWDDRLAIIARDHSEDMARNGYIGHVNLQGEDPTARAIRHGFSVHKEIGGGWYSEGIGENIAEMSTGLVMLTCPSETVRVSNSASGIANAMMDAWMNHDSCQGNGHRDNILRSQYSHIGIGVAYDGSHYIATQDFW